MGSRPNRRTLLKSLAAGVGVTGLGAVEGGLAGRTAAAECPDLADLESTVEDRRATLETVRSQVSTAEDRIAAYESAIESARSKLVETKARYPDDVRSTAKSVGLAARESVMFLDVLTAGGGGTATGWFVGDGRILTNAHNTVDFDTAETVRGWSVDGEAFDLELVGAVEDQSPDVALLETDFDAPALPTRSTDSLSVDDHVVQVGHPGGFGNWVVSLGAVTDLGDDLQTSVPGLQGNSGSPVLNLAGEVVGMTHGSEPGTSTGGTPTPVEPTVHHQPIAPSGDSLHVPVETALTTMEAWT